MYTHHPPFSCLNHVTLKFATQKSGPIYKVRKERPVVVGRSTAAESEFIERLMLWCLWNRNDESDELFTRRIRDGRKKKLLASDVTCAVKLIAQKAGLNPARFGTHSLRRGYATICEYRQNQTGNIGEWNTQARAGWADDSRCPSEVYSRVVLNGAVT